jgi:NAD(P)-dependent dehydrogenase (short-subunit alcohol dehydrogenase family)/acyl carrier protein
MGLTAVEHPLLSAMSPLADSDGYIFSGRVSLREQRWLADHAAFGVVLFPGAGSIDLALCAARTVGARGVAELTLAAPLILTESDSAQLQLSLSADVEGRRELTLYSRSTENDVWTQHAMGVLEMESGESVEDPAFEALRAWRVSEWEALPLDDFYARLRPQGLEYGPAFQGLVGLWRSGSTAYGLVKVPAGLREVGQYGLHPALLDAALHTTLAMVDPGADDEGVMLPFAWSDVELFATGAEELRISVTVESRGDTASARVLIADANGEPVLRVGELQTRRARKDQVQPQHASVQDLYRVQLQAVRADKHVVPEKQQVVLWGDPGSAGGIAGTRYADLTELMAALDQGLPAPDRIVVDASGPVRVHASLAERVHEESARALTLLHGWLREPRLQTSELVWLTAGAMDSAAGVSDLVRAPLLGLLRSVRAEYPERVLRVIDLGRKVGPVDVLSRALGVEGEPELVVFEGEVHAPRLVRHAPEKRGALRRLDLEGTYFLTGGTGNLGRAVAEHLVRAYGVKHLVVTSRSGLSSPGAMEWVAQLEALGADSVRVIACDVGERSELERALSEIDPAHPLRGVVHLAAVLDDGVVMQQTPERLKRAMTPKVDAALHLHELTAGLQLDLFVLFSGGAGTLGSAGQSNYAAANVFLDALASHRASRGLVAQSLVWGLWEQGTTARLSAADVSRLQRQGAVALSLSHGLRLFDVALASDVPVLVPVRLDLKRLQRQLSGAEPAALMRALLKPAMRRAGKTQQGSALRGRLAQLGQEERLSTVVEAVQSEIATVLNLSGPSAVDPQSDLRKLGLDSLMAVELRNRCSAIAGTALPTTLAFDYPTPHALGAFLLSKLIPDAGPNVASTPLLTREDLRLISGILLGLTPQDLDSYGIVPGLLRLRDAEAQRHVPDETPDDEVEVLDRRALMRFVDSKLGAEQ